MAEKANPLPIIPYRSDEPPFACLEINEHWLPFLYAAVYPSRYPEAWLGTLEENKQARLDVLALLNQFQKAEDCMTDNCCPEVPSVTVILHRLSSDGTTLEMSIDNGETWTPDNADPRSQIPVTPPPVPGISNTVCDAAANIVQGLQEAQTLISNTASGQGTLQEITLNVILAILSFLFLPPAGAALLVVLVAGLVRRFLDMGKENYDALFTEERWDIVRCAFACALQDDGKLSNEGMSEAKNYIYMHIPGDNTPNGAAQNIVDVINFVGLAGLNLCAYTFQSSGANCDDCECDECLFDLDFEVLPYYWLLYNARGSWRAGENNGWRTTYFQHTDQDYYIAVVEKVWTKPCFAPYCHFEFFITDSPNTNARASYQTREKIDGEYVWSDAGYNIGTGGVGSHSGTEIFSLGGYTPMYGVRFTLLNIGQPVGHFINRLQLKETAP